MLQTSYVTVDLQASTVSPQPVTHGHVPENPDRDSARLREAFEKMLACGSKHQ